MTLAEKVGSKRPVQLLTCKRGSDGERRRERFPGYHNVTARSIKRTTKTSSEKTFL